MKLRRNKTTTEETSTTTNVLSQLAISERLRRRRNTQTAAVGQAQKRKKDNSLNTDYEKKRGKVAKTSHPTDPKRRSERNTSTVHVSQSSNNTIDRNRKILKHIKHRRQLLAWVRLALSASEVEIQQNIKQAKNAAHEAVSDMVEINHKTSLESDTDQNGTALVSGSAAESTTSTDAGVEQYHSMQQQRSNLQETVMPIYQPPSPKFEAQLDSGNEAQLDSRLPWFYIDLHGKIQGPFDKIQMRQWDAAGYLEENLLISQNWDGPYQALALLFPDRSTAFLPSALDCETANDSEEEDRTSSTDCNPGNDEVSWDYSVNCDGTSRFESLWQQRWL